MYFGHYGQLLCLWSNLSLQIDLANCSMVYQYIWSTGMQLLHVSCFNIQPNTQLKNQPNTQFNRINQIYTLTLTKSDTFQYKLKYILT